MRFLIIAAAVSFSVVLCGSSAATQPTMAGYDSMGPDGVLTIDAPVGTPFHAFDMAGVVVVQGAVAGAEHSVYASNAGPGSAGELLYVDVGGQVFAVGGDDGDWNW